MKRETIAGIYRSSLVTIAFLIPSAFYEAILAVLFIVFLCWIYFKDYKRIKNWIKAPQILWPLFLYLFVIAGFFFADNYNESLSTLSTKIPFLVFPLIVGTSSAVDTPLVWRAGKWLVLSTVFFLFLAIGYAAYDILKTKVETIQIGDGVYSKLRSYGLTRVFPNWHPSYGAMFANFAIAVIVDKRIGRASNSFFKWKGADFLMLSFLILGLILLNSITGLVAGACLILYYGIRLAVDRKFRPFSMLLLIASFCLASILFFVYNPLQLEKIETFKSRGLAITDKEGERNVLTFRLAKWSTYIDIIKEHFWFGTTEGDIKTVRQNAYIGRGYDNLAKLNYNAHNQFLEVGATYGITGLIIFLLFLFQPLFARNYHPLFLGFLLITIISFTTETVLNRQQGILAVMFLYALYTHPFSSKRTF